MSGRLFQYLDVVGPALFQRDLALNPGNPELVWSAVEARYERANLDAEVSELILMSLTDDEDVAADRVDWLRSVFYAYHEDRARRCCRLPKLLDATASRSLNAKVSDLRELATLTVATNLGHDSIDEPGKSS